MKKLSKKKLQRVGNRAGKSNAAIITDEKIWSPVKRRVTQADVDQAAERTNVEKAATQIATLQSRLSELRSEQRSLECRLQSVRSDMATTMLAHAEALARFKDETAITCEVP